MYFPLDAIRETFSNFFSPKEDLPEIQADEVNLLSDEIKEKGELMHRRIGVHKFGYISPLLKPEIAENFREMISTYGDVLLAGKMSFGYRTGSGDVNCIGIAEVIAKFDLPGRYESKLGELVAFQLRIDKDGSIKGDKSAKWAPFQKLIDDVGPEYPQQDAEAYWSNQGRAKDEKERRIIVQSRLLQYNLG